MRFSEDEIEELLQIIKTNLRETQEVKYPVPEHVDGRREGNRNRGGRERSSRGGRGGRRGRQGRGRRSEDATAREHHPDVDQQTETSATKPEENRNEPKEGAKETGAAASGEGSMEVDLPAERGKGRGRGRSGRGRRERGKKGSDD